MARSCSYLVTLIAGLVTLPSVLAQGSRLVTIDPSGEHSRAFLSYLDATALEKLSTMFEIPAYQEYRPLALLLTNSSGKGIVALNVRWQTSSGNRLGTFDSSSDSLLRYSSGMGMGSGMKLRSPLGSSSTPIQLGQSHETVDGPLVLADGERMLVAPGLFVRESTGSPGGSSSIPDRILNAEGISATLDTVVLEDGEVLGPDASHLVDSLRASKASIDRLVNAVRAAEQSGQDGVEALRQFANAPHIPDEGPETMGARSLAHLLMMSRNWREMLQKAADIRLPEFHR